MEVGLWGQKSHRNRTIIGSSDVGVVDEEKLKEVRHLYLPRARNLSWQDGSQGRDGEGWNLRLRG